MELDVLLGGDEENSKLNEHIETELFKDRNIYIAEDVSSIMLEDVLKKIHYFNLIDRKSGKSKEELPPLKVHIESYGGEVHSGWSLIGALAELECEVHTYVRGYAMSMGLALFAIGDRRFISKTGTLMFHELSASGVSGNGEEIKRATKEYERLQTMYNNLLVDRTNLTHEELEDHQERVNDWYIDANQAIENGLATDVL